MLVKGRGNWKLRARPRRVRSWAVSPFMVAPSKRTVPISFASVPQMQLTSVDLPEPLAGGNRQRDSVKRHEAVEAFAHIVDLKQWGVDLDRCGHGVPLRTMASRGRSSRPQARQMTSVSADTSQSQDGPGTTLSAAP